MTNDSLPSGSCSVNKSLASLQTGIRIYDHDDWKMESLPLTLLSFKILHDLLEKNIFWFNHCKKNWPPSPSLHSLSPNPKWEMKSNRVIQSRIISLYLHQLFKRCTSQKKYFFFNFSSRKSITLHLFDTHTHTHITKKGQNQSWN